jgi:hypothetical protein
MEANATSKLVPSLYIKCIKDDQCANELLQKFEFIWGKRQLLWYLENCEFMLFALTPGSKQMPSYMLSITWDSPSFCLYLCYVHSIPHISLDSHQNHIDIISHNIAPLITGKVITGKHNSNTCNYMYR